MARTKGRKRKWSVVHPRAAGIDIGSRFHVVAVSEDLDAKGRYPPAQMIPTNPCDGFHNQHLPSPRMSKQRGESTCSTSGGSILDADSPRTGVNIPRRLTVNCHSP